MLLLPAWQRPHHLYRGSVEVGGDGGAAGDAAVGGGERKQRKKEMRRRFFSTKYKKPHGSGRSTFAPRDPPSLAEPTRSPAVEFLASPRKTVSLIQTKRRVMQNAKQISTAVPAVLSMMESGIVSKAFKSLDGFQCEHFLHVTAV